MSSSAPPTIATTGKAVTVPLSGPDVEKLKRYRLKEGERRDAIPAEGPGVAELFRRGFDDWAREQEART